MQDTATRRFIQGALDGAQALAVAPVYARHAVRDQVALRLCAPEPEPHAATAGSA